MLKKRLRTPPFNPLRDAGKILEEQAPSIGKDLSMTLSRWRMYGNVLGDIFHRGFEHRIRRFEVQRRNVDGWFRAIKGIGKERVKKAK